MATRINMLKLLHEMRGMTDITTRRPFGRPPGLVAIPIRTSRGMPPKAKRVIPISMQDTWDFPEPVKITHLSAAVTPAAEPKP